MKNKKKKKKKTTNIRIKSDISNDELFALLDEIDSGRESDVDRILDEYNTEFVSDKAISKMVDDTRDIVLSETNVHVASELTEPQQEDCEVLRKKRKGQLIYDIKWSSRKLSICTETAFYRLMFNMTLATILHQWIQKICECSRTYQSHSI